MSQPIWEIIILPKDIAIFSDINDFLPFWLPPLAEIKLEIWVLISAKGGNQNGRKSFISEYIAMSFGKMIFSQIGWLLP